MRMHRALVSWEPLPIVIMACYPWAGGSREFVLILPGVDVRTRVVEFKDYT